MEYKGFTYTPTPKTAWDNLSMLEKSEMMKVAVRNGITDLKTIREKYNEFAKGGYLDWKEKASKYKHLDIDNDRTYDYEGWYNENPQRAWDFLNDSPDAHFDDKYKTVYHPTFSTQSKYSGKKDATYNSMGLTGGTWNKQGTVFTMSPDGYRGPVSMDERKWYLENAEDNGVQLREADGSLPIYDGIPWGGVLPNVTVTGNRFAEGGGIHIKDSKKGTFTAAAKKHGMGVQEFASKVLANKENYSPVMVKKANFARNASKWHGEGGNLFEEGGNTNPMNYEYRGTVYSNDLKNQEITHVAELPEVIVTGKNPNRPYVSSFDGSIKPYEELFGALSHGLQPLSLSQHVGAAFDAVQGKRNYLESLFNGNSGFFTDNYAAEYPWISTLGNMAGDIAGGKMLFSGIPKFNKVYNHPQLSSEQQALIDAAIKEAKAGETIGAKALSIAERKKGYQRMKDFISSPEYQARLEAAGMGDYRDYMIDLIEKRLNGNNYFPAWQADEILGNKNFRGLSEVDPTSLDYGVTVRSDLQGKDFLQTFDHEIAHFSTENTHPNFLKDIYESWMHSKRPNFKLQRLMRANDKVAPIRKWKEYFGTLDSNLTKDEIAKLRKKFGYIRMGQERRARAYSLVQEAKRRGISTDELVDMYTIEGDILGDAPKALRELNMVYTPENLKKYVNGFLSISTPITVGINTMSDE